MRSPRTRRKCARLLQSALRFGSARGSPSAAAGAARPVEGSRRRAATGLSCPGERFSPRSGHSASQGARTARTQLMPVAPREHEETRNRQPSTLPGILYHQCSSRLFPHPGQGPYRALTYNHPRITGSVDSALRRAGARLRGKIRRAGAVEITRRAFASPQPRSNIPAVRRRHGTFFLTRNGPSSWSLEYALGQAELGGGARP